MSQVKRSLMVAGMFALTLAGCTGMKESLGAAKQAPDETSVTARAPLVVPATFALKSPQPGAPRPQDSDAADQAQRVLGGAPKVAPATQGELALLAASGAGTSDPNIRQDLRQEVVRKSKRKTYADTVLFWRGRKEDPGTPLDASEEVERIGTPATQVQTAPVIEKGEATPAEPTAQEKKNADKESSGGWFDWF
ncbi:MAG: DUF3035 domain-containing protein [Alphaproteobacteria bacterium]|nr:DUF3035 domain-containing protein [Alphaproteobacteria bacterium]